MHVCALLFFILQFSGSYLSTNYRKEKLIELSVPKTLKKLILKERDSGGLDLYQVVHNKNLLQIKAAVTRHTLNVLDKANISYTVLEDDLIATNNNRRSASIDAKPPGMINNKLTFLRELDYDEIIQFLNSLPHRSTSRRAIFVETIGRSYQGREIKLVRIEHLKAKNVMFFDAGIHAREWLAIDTALNLITNLVESNYTSPINRMNWYIVPLVNPDGYVYSHQTERLQRKNMNFTSCPKECTMCGVDLNRNYAYKWGVNSETTDFCGETYPGVHAFSEKETQAIARTLKKYGSFIKLYVALHTYGCDLLYPWGYEEKPCHDAAELIQAAQIAVNAMNALRNKRRQCKWQVENAGTFPGGGGADDYAKGVMHIKYSYTMELQGGDQYGFTYNASLIKPFVAQSYVGIITLANYVHTSYRRSSRIKTTAEKLTSRGCITKSITPLMYFMPFYFSIKAF